MTSKYAFMKRKNYAANKNSSIWKWTWMQMTITLLEVLLFKSYPWRQSPWRHTNLWLWMILPITLFNSLMWNGKNNLFNVTKCPLFFSCVILCFILGKNMDILLLKFFIIISFLVRWDCMASQITKPVCLRYLLMDLLDVPTVLELTINCSGTNEQHQRVWVAHFTWDIWQK